MAKKYSYFKRDLSWLSFNKRVLLEASDSSLPIYERLKFLSIFSSNLQEFYQVRVAGARAAIERRKETELTKEEAQDTFDQIMSEVSKQEELFYELFYKEVIPDLKAAGVVLHLGLKGLSKRQQKYLYSYFILEVYPHLSPIYLDPEHANPFVRDNRLYLGIVGTKDGSEKEDHYILKMPFGKAERFVGIPSELSTGKNKGLHSFVFLEDVIRLGMAYLLPGYDHLSAYAFRISRDADIKLKESLSGDRLAKEIQGILSLRERGPVARFLHDRNMPVSLRNRLLDLSRVNQETVMPSEPYLMLADLSQLPNPLGKKHELVYPEPVPWLMHLPRGEKMVPALMQHGPTALFTPYNSFENFIAILHSAAINPEVAEIKITQYRVAEESEVIEKMTLAALNGKKVTVFVELKARFDEANNLLTSETLLRAGVKVVYSLPKLKVHAKTCLIRMKSAPDEYKGLACFSTGNFNEDTATIYSDLTYITPEEELVKDLVHFFEYVESKATAKKPFQHLLIPKLGLVEELKDLIKFEKKQAKAGKEARIILKMNALQDNFMIDELYKASEVGVRVDLVVRGICCAIPEKPFSKNITETRIVDMYLEHTRLWYFYHGGEERIYIASADWMKRNLYKRIEYVAPILDPTVKEYAKRILQLQLQATNKAYYVDSNLENIPKTDEKKEVRLQTDMYAIVRAFSDPES